MELRLERCTIRDWHQDDAASLAKHANNRRVWLGLRDLFPHPYTIDDANEFLRHATTAQPVTNFCIDIDGFAPLREDSVALASWLWGQRASCLLNRVCN